MAVPRFGAGSFIMPDKAQKKPLPLIPALDLPCPHLIYLIRGSDLKKEKPFSSLL